MSHRVVVIGTGLAGVRAIEELIERGFDGGCITVFGEEPHAPYDRIQLSAVLAGDKERSEIVTRDAAWFRDHGIQLVTGCRVTEIDRERRHAGFAHRRVLQFLCVRHRSKA